MTTYTRTPLFGGALTVDLPSSFQDVSEIRQVPDHQEVWISRTCYASIVVDILERVAPPAHPVTDDLAALRYHFADVTATGHAREAWKDQETTRVWRESSVRAVKLGAGVPALEMVATQHALETASGEGKEPVAEITGIVLLMMRLVEQKTDLLVAINVPHVKGEYDPALLRLDGETAVFGPLMETAFAWSEQVLQTLTVQDWRLFVQEE